MMHMVMSPMNTCLVEMPSLLTKYIFRHEESLECA